MFLRWLEIVKDAFLVYDDFRDSGQRVSKEMFSGAIGLVSSAAVLVWGVGLENEDIMAGGAFLYSLYFMFLRYRSDGGKIKLKEDRSPPGDTDEHATDILGDESDNTP